eukprot:CAMPEP_0113533054 /NCGR_PEP_ID=MMETSP0015_2-20120614/4391_1 /TAXON_ID=2838 /ORGANISM="Odontella" /LENGTH=467 /DNA_ID=CAMNT_0000432063 /DNA_START=335 /DNA_END=1738 /DNA_ORIENTATION=- /assembly_acc=CAM_ASM_000160
MPTKRLRNGAENRHLKEPPIRVPPVDNISFLSDLDDADVSTDIKSSKSPETLTSTTVTAPHKTASTTVTTDDSPIDVTTSASTDPVTVKQGSSNADGGCILDGFGTFGESGDDPEETIVSYRYEIEMSRTYDYRGGVQTSLKQTILPAVEEEINNAVLAVLLPTGCRRRERRLVRAWRGGGVWRGQVSFQPEEILRGRLATERAGGGSDNSDNRQLKVIGMNPKPYDEVDGASCTKQEEGSENWCSVVEGSLTLLTDSDSSTETLVALNAIRGGMDSGNFTRAHPAVVKISFVEKELINALRADNTQSDVSANANPSALTFIAMGSVIGVLLAGLILYRRRQRKIDDNACIDSSDSNDFDEFSSESAESAMSEGKDTAIGIHRNPAAPPDLSYGLSSDSEMDSSYASTTPRSTDPTELDTTMFTDFDYSVSSSNRAKRGAVGAYPNRLLGDDETSDHGYDDDLLYSG